MTDISLEMNDRKAKQYLRLLIAASSGQSRLMAAIAQELLVQTERNFQQEGRPKWPNLAPSTQKARQREGHGGAHPILRGRRPHLARALVTGFSDKEARIGSNVTYAAIHQLGGKAGRNHAANIPARPFFPVEADRKTATPYLRKAIQALLLKYYRRTLREI